MPDDLWAAVPEVGGRRSEVARTYIFCVSASMDWSFSSEACTERMGFLIHFSWAAAFVVFSAAAGPG